MINFDMYYSPLLIFIGLDAKIQTDILIIYNFENMTNLTESIEYC